MRTASLKKKGNSGSKPARHARLDALRRGSRTTWPKKVSLVRIEVLPPRQSLNRPALSFEITAYA